MMRGGKRVDAIRRKVAVEKEAVSAAALYATADDARKAFYGSKDVASNPVHNLGREIIQAFVQVHPLVSLGCVRVFCH